MKDPNDIQGFQPTQTAAHNTHVSYTEFECISLCTGREICKNTKFEKMNDYQHAFQKPDDKYNIQNAANR